MPMGARFFNNSQRYIPSLWVSSAPSVRHSAGAKPGAMMDKTSEVVKRYFEYRRAGLAPATAWKYARIAVVPRELLLHGMMQWLSDAMAR